MSIGAELAAARRQAGLTVTEVSHRTRIREAIVQGIERDDFSPCGGDFYARGHIRAIARVAGIDPEPLVREYDEAREAATQEITIPAGRASRPTPGVPGKTAVASSPVAVGQPVAAGQPEPAGKPEATGKKPESARVPAQGEPTAADKPSGNGKTALPRRPVPAADTGMAAAGRAAALSGRAATLPAKLVIPAPGGPATGRGGLAPPSLPPLPSGPRLPLWGTALVAVLAATAGVLIYHAVSSHPSSHLTGSPAAAASRPATPPKVSTQPPATPAPTATPTPTPTPTPNTVVIALDAVSEPCWAQITSADGTTLYEGIVSTGTTMTWTEGQAVTLSIGNPSAITLTVDGKAQTGLGVNPVTLNLAPGGQ